MEQHWHPHIGVIRFYILTKFGNEIIIIKWIVMVDMFLYQRYAMMTILSINENWYLPYYL